MKTFSKYLEGKNQEDVFGWLSPSGKFYSCGMFDHARVVLSSSELRKHLNSAQGFSIEIIKSLSINML